jgi:sugar lactone lactonase YvrE
MLGLIFFAGVMLSHGPSRTKVTSTPSTTANAPATKHVAVKPAAEQLAHSAAVKLAAKLPVTLESAALLRVGKNLYVVGGTARHGAQPTDAILRIDLATGRVRAAGHFIEPLTDAAAAPRAGVLYLAGGWTGAKLATAVLRWSPGKTATVVTRLPVAIRGTSAAFVGDRLYVAGGSPRAMFVVDVRSGKVVRVTTTPRQLRRPGSNLDYLTSAEKRP